MVFRLQFSHRPAPTSRFRIPVALLKRNSSIRTPDLLFILLFGGTVFFIPASGAGPEYAGPAACKPCHASIYSDFIISGHPYKLSKVVDGKPPVHPFSEVPNPPPGYAWEDISYVIGGYGWKANFIDRNGYIITGEAAQYDLATSAWAPYHAEDPPGTKPYDCGACHTTGWKTAEENGGRREDGMQGMGGTFVLPGVTCEACHMPLLTKSAETSGRSDVLGDIPSHTFRLNTDWNVRMFSEDGSHLNLDEEGDAVVTADVACLRCHNGEKESMESLYWMLGNGRLIHRPVPESGKGKPGDSNP